MFVISGVIKNTARIYQKIIKVHKAASEVRLNNMTNRSVKIFEGGKS